LAKRTCAGSYADTVGGVVVVDDIVATGQSLSENLRRFLSDNAQIIKDRSITVVAVALLATQQGDEVVRAALRRNSYRDVDFRVCEILNRSAQAFVEGNGIWESDEEASRAKALVQDLGRRIYKDSPLGFGNLGLLVVLSDTCPNNSLPILHSVGAGKSWKPLFSRPAN
jgi:hypothetical protein